MRSLLDGGIQDIFFLALRLMAAAGGALVGWFVTGPVVQTLLYVIFRKKPPDWVVSWLRLGGALLLAWLVFLFAPIGGGLGGGGSGGGKGDGVGNKEGGKGAGKTTDPGKGDGKSAGATNATPPGKDVLLIEVLGGEDVKDYRFYILNKKGPPVNWDHLKRHLADTKTNWGEIRILLTGDSVFEDDVVVKRVRDWATENGIKRSVTRTADPK